MAKNYYFLDPKLLSFTQSKKSFSEKIFKFLLYFIVALSIAIVINRFYLFHITSPSEISLMMQKERLLKDYLAIQNAILRIDSVLSTIQYNDDNFYRSVLDLEPISPSIRDVGIGGHNQAADLKNIDNTGLVIQTAQRLEYIRGKLQVQQKSYQEVFEMATMKEDYFECKPAIMPISLKNYSYISSYFGYRIDPYYKCVRFHKGLDFPTRRGSPVYSTGKGVVKLVKHSCRGYGKEVVIDHGYGFTTRYAHLHRIYVKEGQKVLRGTQIGEVGSTGKSTGPHLHYEVRINNTPVNPKYYYNDDLSMKEYEKIVTLAMKNK